MMGAANVLPLISGKVVQSDAADNATATATQAATLAVRHIHLGVTADYSATVSAVKTITLKRGTTTILVIRHDFTLGPAMYPLPVGLAGGYSEAISVELEASGTGGVTGRCAMFYISS